MSDHYVTIGAGVEDERKIERSRFLGIAFPVAAEETFFERLTAVQKEHFDATHHCWAFRLMTPARTRSTDAGEPSGTAGKPILAAIEGAGLHDVGVIVVRWYGGIKLGTGGLARAYRETAAAALGDAVRLDRYLYEPVRVIVPFEALSTVYRLIEPPNILLQAESFGDENVFTFDVRLTRVEAFLHLLEEKRLAWRREPVA